jgi:EAL and modified HD-GYP domain-containing signal transduction protein
VLEILEDVPADEETVRECRLLKNAGYKFALDDIVSITDRLAFFDIADIIKVDFILAALSQQQAITKRFRGRGVQFLAEKVETHEQFRSAVNMGYTLFQGYFFCRPETMEARDLPSVHSGHLALLRKVCEPELDIPEIARAIREEPSLYYRLLRYLNSAAFGHYPVKSIIHALNLLGRDEIRRWATLVAVISLAGPRSAELIHLALVRARFCELLAEHKALPAQDFFQAGLFSLLDAILNRPLSQIVEHIPLSESCRDALTGVRNCQHCALELAIAFSRGDWEQLPQLCGQVQCTEVEACSWQLEAQRWARSMSAKPPTAGKFPVSAH